MPLIRDAAGSTLAIMVGAIAAAVWVSAITYDYKRGEPLLAAAWVACPPCGVARGGYVYFVN